MDEASLSYSESSSDDGEQNQKNEDGVPFGVSQKKKESTFHVNTDSLIIPNGKPDWLTFDLPEIKDPDNTVILQQLEQTYEITNLYQKMRAAQ